MIYRLNWKQKRRTESQVLDDFRQVNQRNPSRCAVCNRLVLVGEPMVWVSSTIGSAMPGKRDPYETLRKATMQDTSATGVCVPCLQDCP